MALTQPACQRYAELFGELIQTALREDAAVKCTQRGSEEELAAITSFVAARHPGLEPIFVMWCGGRSGLPGATPNGVHMQLRTFARVDTRTLNVEIKAGWPAFSW